MSLLIPDVSKMTPWVITTGESAAVSFGELLVGGITAFSFYLSQDFAATPAEMVKMKFVGAGKGFGVGLPLDISFGPSQMPGRGLVYAGDQTPSGRGLEIPDFAGRCCVHVFGAAAVGSVCSTVVYFGSDVPTRKTAREIGVVTGTGFGTPGASAMEYNGKIWRA